MADSKVTLKLLVDTQAGKVLFAEAGKDFVDFLFYVLSLPVGTVVKLLSSKSMVGCLGDLYDSINSLSETYMQPNQNKNLVLNPKCPTCATGLPLLMSHQESKTQKFYTCNNDNGNGYSHSFGYSYKVHYNVSDVPNVLCPQCQKYMNREMSYISPARENTGAVAVGGFIKGVVTYMVMDNLEVMPVSTISSITLINKFDVKDVGALEERVVDFCIDEGVKLLKASLECKNVLTSIFIGKNKGRK
ncbi:uncharacterized protein LOC116145198 [Pistacia vera]|uniref:uncharacterized protein LOC116145198 n=1 Tax=Pistacia vera TaxID=55513 RepID=UPI0012638023|nr:uncharacterized protein LOC116145198 [Pistacia vera]